MEWNVIGIGGERGEKGRGDKGWRWFGERAVSWTEMPWVTRSEEEVDLFEEDCERTSVDEVEVEEFVREWSGRGGEEVTVGIVLAEPKRT